MKREVVQELCEVGCRTGAVWTGRSYRSCVNREVVQELFEQGGRTGAV